MKSNNGSFYYTRRIVKITLLIIYLGLLYSLFKVVMEKETTNISALVAIILAVLTINIKMIDEF